MGKHKGSEGPKWEIKKGFLQSFVDDRGEKSWRMGESRGPKIISDGGMLRRPGGRGGGGTHLT